MEAMNRPYTLLKNCTGEGLRLQNAKQLTLRGGNGKASSLEAFFYRFRVTPIGAMIRNKKGNMIAFLKATRDEISYSLQRNVVSERWNGTVRKHWLKSLEVFQFLKRS